MVVSKKQPDILKKQHTSLFQSFIHYFANYVKKWLGDDKDFYLNFCTEYFLIKIINIYNS